MSASTMTEAPPDGERWVKAFSRDELQSLLAVSDLRAWGVIALDWAIVFAAMAVVARWPSPLTVVPALFVIGGRQLGLAILMHEASHRILLSVRRWNDLVGNWLCAYPVWGDLVPYRAYHLQHHAKTGTAEDPDIGLAAEWKGSRPKVPFYTCTAIAFHPWNPTFRFPYQADSADFRGTPSL